MDDFDPPQTSPQAMDELWVALMALRNAWVEMELILRDVQFEADAIKRRAASQEVDRILCRINGCPDRTTHLKPLDPH